MDKLKNKIQSWLQIQPAYASTIIINEDLDYKGNAIKNRIWYRGDSYELDQLYKQIPGRRDSFWAAVPSTNMNIRKIHTGLPSIIVDTLADIVLDDLNDFGFINAADEDLWMDVADENKFNKLLERALKEVLYIGDGAFKISFDPEMSELPILEFFSGEKIDIKYKRGRLDKIVFKSECESGGKMYILHEIYGRGYVDYVLKNQNGDEIPLNTIDDTGDLARVEFADPNQMWAVPLIIYESSKWEGRGQSILDKKTDDFDALDEAWSQWMDALRAGRSKTYIPENLIPRDKENGMLIRPNAFDNRFIVTKGLFNPESGQSPKAEVIQPAIPHDSYLNTYITALDLCMQGLISPSTLGIDVKKLDNAEAQREKEKATLYSRAAIVGCLEDALPSLIETVLSAYRQWSNVGGASDAVQVDVDFGEYANPSFEAQVETVAKARTGGIMSIEAAVDELYGDSKDPQWKTEEVDRLKQEQGIAEMMEPAVGNEIVEDVPTNPEPVVTTDAGL
ncbi:phage portal protein [Eubacterium aggregans]|uniref:phage portal protein n=1 Tax=Eubacterium aggregans TaxID=81409 RepID=UPI001FA81872|nr:phage portal protein [Eubacterium aggregans]